MTHIWPRRAWAAAAAATVAAIAIAGFASDADASTSTLVGVDRVTFAWQPASGQFSYYLVSRSLNGGALKLYASIGGTQIQMPVAPGDQIRISVAAAGYDSAGVLRIGPASALSDLVAVQPSPQFPASGSWLLRCASCPQVARRLIADASVVAAQSAGLPAPWVVLGHAVLGGADTIVWHNPETGELALWDWTTLAPVPIASPLVGAALRGVGAADLDHDGIQEFLVQRTDTLVVSAWSLTSNGFRRVAQLTGPPGAFLVAAKDFDRDGKIDLLWHNPTAGTLDLARFLANPILGTGGTVVSLVSPATTRLMSGLASNALVASTADYDGDRSQDVLLRYATGRLAILYLNGGVPDGLVWLPAAADDVNREVIDSRSVDGVPGAEIALQHRPTGEISILVPNQTSRTVVLSAGSKWEALGIGW